MAKKGRSALFARLLRESCVANGCKDDASVSDAFDKAFLALKSIGSRDEYVYRAALTHKILMGTHSLNTASMLNEFRAGDCRADIVILNGTATVYEIKSERDSLTRLDKQISNYRRVFAKVYVISSEAHVDNIASTIPKDVGILRLSQRYQISTLREAKNDPGRICTTTLFESLRRTEAKTVLEELKINIPSAPNTEMHSLLRQAFKNLDPENTHRTVVKVLKKTRSLSPLSELVKNLPSSLHAAALSIPLHKTDHDRLITATKTPLSDASSWI